MFINFLYIFRRRRLHVVLFSTTMQDHSTSTTSWCFFDDVVH